MTGNSVSQAALDQAVAKRDTARARVDQAAASLQKARDQMGYTELKAEFDGVVTQRLAEVGQVLSAGQGVVTVARPDVREAVVDVPESLCRRDAAGRRLHGRAPECAGADGARARARDRAAGRSGDALQAHPHHPGRSGSGLPPRRDHRRRARPARSRRRFLLPASALLDEGDRRSVWVVAADGKSVTRRDVTLATVQDRAEDRPRRDRRRAEGRRAGRGRGCPCASRKARPCA